jgi:HPt (histidine-containing phosphotransfer) domain-containing protein
MSKLYSPETIELISKGNLTFKQRLIETLVKSSNASIEVLKSGIQHDNTNEIYNAAHKVKPSLQYIGANELFELAKFIESHTKEVPDLKNEIKEKSVELLNQLQILLNQIQEDF